MRRAASGGGEHHEEGHDEHVAVLHEPSSREPVEREADLSGPSSKEPGECSSKDRKEQHVTRHASASLRPRRG